MNENELQNEQATEQDKVVSEPQTDLTDLEPEGEVVAGGLTGNRIAPPFIRL